LRPVGLNVRKVAREIAAPNDGDMRGILIILWAAMTLAPIPARADGEQAAAEFKVRATLVELPRTRPCNRDGVGLTTATARYRLLESLKGKVAAEHLLVNHRCPEYSRGPSRYGKGTAPPLRPGDVHLLTLRRLAVAQKGPPRYAALRTDPGRRPPRIIAIVSGGGGTNHKLIFDAERVTVGRAPDADVRLVDRAVSPNQLTVQLNPGGDQLTVTSTSRLGKVGLNGAPLAKARTISFQDRIQLGSYTLRFALFLDPADQS
jgi:hypothetical protein